MITTRGCGILLHPTSLPGPFGIGDLGPEAFRFVDYLAEAGVSAWQMLPVVPPDGWQCPYSALSAFAGNPWLISPEALAAQGWLRAEALADLPDFPADRVDFPAVTACKTRLLRAAFAGFRADGGETLPAYRAFCHEHAAWLEDYALFMAAREAHGQQAWHSWPAELAQRAPAALAQWRARLADAMAYQRFLQYVFFAQWAALRAYARERQVQLIGDLPIFIAHDSADVWSHPGLFHLDAAGEAALVAGVPPDFFSPTGQRWGNPLYDWAAHRATGFAWWVERFRHTLRLVDQIRLDHFCGFIRYWEVPGAAPTAEHGCWRPGPGAALFAAAHAELGPLPLIAEDLGHVTAEVTALRARFGIPGMAVLQYAFSGDRAPSPHLPHRYVPNQVAYTGTHDNDTLVGWWTRAGWDADASRHYLREYLQTGDWEIHWACLRALIASAAGLVIFPLQDLYALGTEARMNVPGRPEGNWGWRAAPGLFSSEAQQRLRGLLTLFERLGNLPIAAEEPDAAEAALVRA